MDLIVDNSEKLKFRMDGVERTFFESIIHAQASEINREYLNSPEILKTLKIEDRLKDGFQIIISVINKKIKERYAVNVSAGRLSLNPFKPARRFNIIL